MKKAILNFAVAILSGALASILILVGANKSCGDKITIFGDGERVVYKYDTTYVPYLVPGKAGEVKTEYKTRRDTIYKEVLKEDSVKIRERLATIDSLHRLLKSQLVDRVYEIDTCLDSKPKVCLSIGYSSVNERYYIKWVMDSLSFNVPMVTKYIEIKKQWYEEPYVSYPVGFVGGILTTILILNSGR